MKEFIELLKDQANREYKVYIRNVSRLISIMQNKNYKLKFKSSLPWDTKEFMDKSFFSKVIMLNLLFN